MGWFSKLFGGGTSSSLSKASHEQLIETLTAIASAARNSPIAPPELLRICRSCLGHEEGKVRRAAVEILIFRRDPESEQLLIEVVNELLIHYDIDSRRRIGNKYVFEHVAVRSDVLELVMARNRSRWEASHDALEWVKYRKGQWNSRDFTNLLKHLENTSYWPLTPEGVSGSLESIRNNLASILSGEVLNAGDPDASIFSCWRGTPQPRIRDYEWAWLSLPEFANIIIRAAACSNRGSYSFHRAWDALKNFKWEPRNDEEKCMHCCGGTVNFNIESKSLKDKIQAIGSHGDRGINLLLRLCDNSCLCGEYARHHLVDLGVIGVFRTLVKCFGEMDLRGCVTQRFERSTDLDRCTTYFQHIQVFLQRDARSLDANDLQNVMGLTDKTYSEFTPGDHVDLGSWGGFGDVGQSERKTIVCEPLRKLANKELVRRGSAETS